MEEVAEEGVSDGIVDGKDLEGGCSERIWKGDVQKSHGRNADGVKGRRGKGNGRSDA